MRKQYAGGANEVQLSAAITSTAFLLPVTTMSGWPVASGAAFVVLLQDSLKSEKILCRYVNQNELNVVESQRGHDGTTAAAFGVGTTVKHVLDAATVNDLWDETETLDTRIDTTEASLQTNIDSVLDPVFKPGTADVTYYVHNGTGLDSNTGLVVTDAFKTVDRALQEVPKFLDYQVTIALVGLSVYTEMIRISGFIFDRLGRITLKGQNSSKPYVRVTGDFFAYNMDGAYGNEGSLKIENLRFEGRCSFNGVQKAYISDCEQRISWSYPIEFLHSTAEVFNFDVGSGLCTYMLLANHQSNVLIKSVTGYASSYAAYVLNGSKVVFSTVPELSGNGHRTNQGGEVFEGWQTVGEAGKPPFENGYSSYGVLYPVRFKRVGALTVIEGLAAVGPDGSHIFTLPNGYRPDKNVYLAGLNNGNESGQYIIFSDGRVRRDTGGIWRSVHATFAAKDI